MNWNLVRLKKIKPGCFNRKFRLFETKPVRLNYTQITFEYPGPARRKKNMNQNLIKSEPLKTKMTSQDWGSMEWLVDDSLSPGADMSVAVMTVKMGEVAPAHSHPNCHEFIYLVQGTIEEIVNDQKRVLMVGDSVYIPAGTVHGTRNLG